MRGPFLPLSEWFMILPFDVSECPVSSVHIIQFLFLLYTWEGECQLCAQPVVMYKAMVDDSIYEGLSPVGNLRTNTQVGLSITIYYVGLIT